MLNLIPMGKQRRGRGEKKRSLTLLTGACLAAGPSGDVLPLAHARVLVEVQLSVARVRLVDAADAEVEDVADRGVLVGEDAVHARTLDAARRGGLCRITRKRMRNERADDMGRRNKALLVAALLADRRIDYAPPASKSVPVTLVNNSFKLW